MINVTDAILVPTTAAKVLAHTLGKYINSYVHIPDR